ncbi:HpcH/HpaI aldolase family protein [Chakrabartyella piscis]|uniref:HpcH/HpaI aldolase family protein n=1 Tax=Chakrabartyella piscis TaxID=2918914 RepID=UPI0029589F6A|nr:aldolase/citrate lyase family protein [Chakrabartyella piscis]
MRNTFKEKLEQGQKTIGTFFEMGGTCVAEAAAYSDLDYIIIDNEHGKYEVENILELFRAMEIHDGTAFVRTKDATRASVSKMLDIGAKGLVVPQIETVEQVKKLVEYTKYYPLGNRGLAFVRGAGFGYAKHAKQDINGYFKECNEKTLLVPQCETKGCLEHIEEVMEIDGVDGIFVGPFDLSVAMGIPLQFDRPEFQAALERILKAAKDAGKFTMIFCATTEAAKKNLADGFDSVAVSMDVNHYISALNQVVSDLK